MERPIKEEPKVLDDSPRFVETICRQNGLQLQRDQLQRLLEFTGLLLSWNTKINLISRVDSKNIWTTHVLHSLSPLFIIDIPLNLRILDLGSGGGFPGIPIAIARNDIRVTLVDSIKKKTAALEQMIGELGLTNVSVISARAEDLAKETSRFNIVFARAVTSLDNLIQWSKPILRVRTPGAASIRARVGGDPKGFKLPCLLAMKGGDLEKEIRSAATKTGERKITTLDLSFSGSREVGLENKKLVIVEL